uniref:helix-turn-helix domain-containing protein n=1 Tax=Pediococcus inopinatus TaxID=114090 RepID=UPI000AE4F1AA
MFSKENKINAVLELTSGLPQSIIMKKYGIKGSATLYEWKRRLEQFGVEGLSLNHKKTYFDYSFKMKVIKWS